jgi:hypothetical protein
MSTSFDELFEQIEAEARAEGPDAAAGAVTRRFGPSLVSGSTSQSTPSRAPAWPCSMAANVEVQNPC